MSSYREVPNWFEIVEAAQKQLRGWAILVCWTVDDALLRAEDRGIQLTADQAWRVIDRAYRRMDAEDGVNWSVIDDCIDDILEKDGEWE